MNGNPRHDANVKWRILDEIERAQRVRRSSEQWRLTKLRSYGRVVHHRDGNPWNNHPENLVVMDPTEHGR